MEGLKKHNLKNMKRSSYQLLTDTEQSPEERLRDKYKRRAAYHRFYTNMKWGHAQNYHLTLDSGVLGIEKCVALICEVYH